jgi:PII-like signaling protein
MRIEGDGKLVRIFIGEGDRAGREPLYDVIVRLARERGLAGATVLRGLAGFGAKSRLHTASILRLSADLPIVIEIVDRPERIDAFLPELDRLVTEGLITTEPVHVIAYRGGRPAEPQGG